MFWTNAAIDVLLVFFVIDCLFMCLVVLMQRSKQEGLGAAFGGGITESMWGAQTSQVLVKTTVWLAAIFFILSISLARLYSHRATLLDKDSVQLDLLKAPTTPAPAPATTPAPTAPATPAPVAPVNNNTSAPATPTPPAPAASNAPASAAPAKPAAK